MSRKLTTPLVAAIAGAMTWMPAEAGAQTSWLDEESPASWNAGGKSVPAAPARENGEPRCRDEARSPQSDEDRTVVERGWDLFGRPQQGDSVVVITGTANYDGMCRPWQYQAFVFVNGTFAGTLSPEPMDSRADGALGSVSIDSSQRLTAEYGRYTEDDPLCCPSNTTTVEFGIEDTGDGPIVRPLSTATQPSDH